MLRRRAWEVADRLWWSETYDVEYVALTQLQADAFVTLSGGLGTLDETVEIITWRQLGLHDKPIVVLDVGGWARPFVALVEAVIGMGFAAEANRRLFEVAPDVPAALRLLRVMRTEEATAEASERL